jgi:hypothetical protein
MFTQLLSAKAQQVYPVEVKDAEWAKVQKEARIIDTLEPIMNQHRLIVCPSVIQKDYNSTESYTADSQQAYRLFYQMTRITRDRGALKHDDRLDAVAGAVAHWTEYMNRDSEKAHLTAREAAVDAELQKFMDQVIGRDRFNTGTEDRFASSIMSGRRR